MAPGLPRGGRRCPACGLCFWSGDQDEECPAAGKVLNYAVHFSLEDLQRLHAPNVLLAADTGAVALAADGVPKKCLLFLARR